MKPSQLILRCYAKQEKDDLWVAVCLDLCLAAQGESCQEARHKLIEQINDYVYDTLAGEDQDYATQLLPRRAPWVQWLTYYRIKAHLLLRHSASLFRTKIPLYPAMP